ncbi:MAG: SAM-dependent methyltransferase [Nitrospira sp.]|nr:SAM-dependent methyltransferase [Nitrospira sp.]
MRALPASAGQAGNGPDTWVAGLVGTQSERFRKVTLTRRDLESLTILDVRHTYAGDGRLLRLGLQAYSLGIAYEFDPYFGLSISRVDPLPHQLEAIYDYLKADFILANPPFNVSDWGGERLRTDARWRFGVPPVGNANFAWVQHIVHHLAPAGLAGFVLANGSMSSNQSGEV